jgi:hypothetical protein
MRVRGSLALAGFALALVVHIETIAGVDVYSRFPAVWLLHLGALLLCGLSILSAGYRLKPSEIVYHLPTWAIVIVATVFVYSLINFLVCASVTGGGNADMLGTQYVLVDHGRVSAHISRAEYHLHRAYELRAFSGHWIFFYLLPTVYFFLWHDDFSGDTRLSSSSYRTSP